jgi:hypothetical protein
LKSAKECVTTHLPNELVLKMDSAEVEYRYLTVTILRVTSRRAYRSC